MQVVYFGKKRPKVVMLVINGERVEETFEPFKAKEVGEDFGGKLLLNAGDIFKRYDIDRSAPDPKAKAKTNGYVGDRTADSIEDLDKQIEKDESVEEGKAADDIIAEAQAEAVKKSDAKKAAKANKTGKTAKTAKTKSTKKQMV